MHNLDLAAALRVWQLEGSILLVLMSAIVLFISIDDHKIKTKGD